MKQFEVKIGDKIEFELFDRVNQINYGVMTGIVQNIEYPYEHEWDDIYVICDQFPEGIEIISKNVIRVIKD